LSLVAQELAFPGIIFPCFVALAILMAILFRKGFPDLPPRYRDSLMSWWSLVLAVLVAAGGIYYLRERVVNTQISIEVDMEVGRGNLVELYLNDLRLDPYRTQVLEGRRHVYRFDKLPHEITLLRLDPTEQRDTRVIIYSITVKSGDRVVREFEPSELKDWTLANFSAPAEDAGGLVMSSTTNDPILWTSPALRLSGAQLAKSSAFVDESDGPFVLVATAFLLVLLARTSTRAGRLQAVLIAAASCVGFPVLFAIKHIDLLPPPVTTTVGYASYHSYSKANEILSGVLIMLILIGLGYGCAKWVGRKEAAGSGAEEFAGAGPPSRQRWIWMAHAGVFVFLFLYFFPYILGVFQSMSRAEYRYDSWDAANTLIWSALINKGFIPYRDFWYPYGGFYLQLLRFPAGPIWVIVHCTVLLWCFYLVLLKIAERRLAQTLVMFGAVLVPILLNMLGGWHRYLMPATVVFFYAAICDIRRWEWKTHLPFTALAGYVCFCEPPQIICAACGIAVHCGLEAAARFQGSSFRDRLASSWQVLRPRLILIGGPILAGVGGAALVYAANGMLPGLWDFEKSVADIGDYSAAPSDMARWMLPVLQPDTIFLLLFLAAAYAAYRWVRLKGASDPLGTALITLCGAGFVAMQKQIVRPHIMTQWRVYPYVAMVLFGLMVWRERKLSRMVIAIFLGCIAGIAAHEKFFSAIFDSDFKGAPHNVIAVADLLLHQRKEIDQANDALYARSRFEAFTQQNAVVDNLTDACGLHPQDSVFVLGDDLVFYILLNQETPYSTNVYNESPIYEQQKVLDWLNRRDPRFVIWAPGAAPQTLAFDVVPNVVRLPLIYSHIVQNYKFLRVVGPYHILARRAATESPDLNYWRQTLGTSIDLGGIPRRARLASYDTCEGDKARCDALLVVRYPQSAPVPRSKLKVMVEAAGSPFQVQLDVAPGQREYVVNMNRLWFWNPLARSGTPQIVVEDEHARAFLGYHRERGQVLY
jgi:hypothetical protein